MIWKTLEILKANIDLPYVNTSFNRKKSSSNYFYIFIKIIFQFGTFVYLDDSRNQLTRCLVEN